MCLEINFPFSIWKVPLISGAEQHAPVSDPRWQGSLWCCYSQQTCTESNFCILLRDWGWRETSEFVLGMGWMWWVHLSSLSGFSLLVTAALENKLQAAKSWEEFGPGAQAGSTKKCYNPPGRLQLEEGKAVPMRPPRVTHREWMLFCTWLQTTTPSSFLPQWVLCVRVSVELCLRQDGSGVLQHPYPVHCPHCWAGSKPTLPKTPFLVAQTPWEMQCFTEQGGNVQITSALCVVQKGPNVSETRVFCDLYLWSWKAKARQAEPLSAGTSQSYRCVRVMGVIHSQSDFTVFSIYLALRLQKMLKDQL